MRLATVVTAAAALFIFYGAHAEADLLTNGNFDGGLQGWTQTVHGYGSVEHSSVSHDGSGAAHISVPFGPHWASISQEVKLIKGQRYCFSAWLQQTQGGWGGFGLSIITPDGQPQPVDFIVAAGSDWTFTRTCFVTAHRLATVVVWAYPGLSGGGGYVDSLSLVRDAIPAVATPVGPK